MPRDASVSAAINRIWRKVTPAGKSRGGVRAWEGGGRAKVSLVRNFRFNVKARRCTKFIRRKVNNFQRFLGPNKGDDLIMRPSVSRREKFAKLFRLFYESSEVSRRARYEFENVLCQNYNIIIIFSFQLYCVFYKTFYFFTV